MDTRQMEYIIQISEERSITKAAEKLFITQSALNQQLLRLEFLQLPLVRFLVLQVRWLWEHLLRQE